MMAIEQTQRLYRSERFNTFGGVCAGIAVNKGWSIALTRIICLVLGMVTGVGILLYLAAWALVPRASRIGAVETEGLYSDPLHRSSRDKMVSGVCGGIADLLQVDSSLVRISFVLIFLAGGVGLIPYVYAWIIVPFDRQSR